MYIDVDFNLLYQLEKIAKRTGQSVSDLVNEAVAEYIDNQTITTESPSIAPDDD